jgi:(p)ppGpp synthase/HD superfamily hydrolase
MNDIESLNDAKDKYDAELLTLCAGLARTAHAGQTRWDGITPYIEHPMRVANACRDIDEKCVAMLHDAIEDTGVTVDNLLESGVPQHIVEAVLALTKPVIHPVSYEKYLIQVKANPLATRVKIQDILDNLGDQPSSKQVKKYAGALKFLLA